MKKLLVVILCVMLSVSMFAACSNETNGNNKENKADKQENESNNLKIGFANLDDSIAFAQLVKESIIKNCEKNNIELILADNKLDGPTALSNAESFILQEVDGVIEFQTDVKFGEVIMEKFNENEIPVIAIDIPMPGATFFGANNYQAGRLAGEGLAKWINENWGEADAIISLELPQSGEPTMQRSKGMREGLIENLEKEVPQDMIFREDCHHTQEESKRVVDDLLTKIPKDAKIAFVCVQDMSALGAIASVETAGREENAIVASQNCGPEAINEMIRPQTRLLGSTGYFPERYGDKLVPAMIDKMQGKSVPDKIYVDHVFVTLEELFNYYPEAKEKYDELRK